MDVINLIIQLQSSNCEGNGINMKDAIMENEKYATETTGVHVNRLIRLKIDFAALEDAVKAGDLIRWKGKVGLSRDFVKGV